MKNFNYNEEVMQKNLYYCKSKELIPITYIFDVTSEILMKLYQVQNAKYMFKLH